MQAAGDNRSDHRIRTHQIVQLMQVWTKKYIVRHFGFTCIFTSSEATLGTTESHQSSIRLGWMGIQWTQCLKMPFEADLKTTWLLEINHHVFFLVVFAGFSSLIRFILNQRTFWPLLLHISMACNSWDQSAQIRVEICHSWIHFDKDSVVGSCIFLVLLFHSDHVPAYAVNYAW